MISIRLSQGHLNLLDRCPRQFQHTYLDQLSPSSLEQQERQTWGSRFHLLMQQRELGLPIDALVQEDAQLQHWMTAFSDAAPDILAKSTQFPEVASGRTLASNPTNNTFRESEHCRTLQVQGYLLTVVYDLLIANEEFAQILDWKTYPKPQNRRWLAENWQTLLYLYVLVETSGYLPEQVSMTYWFVQSLNKPQSLKFAYNTAQHQQTEQKLNDLLNHLTVWLQRYQDGEPFPQVASSSQRCDRCTFAVRCRRERYSGEVTLGKDSLTLANIQEVSL